MKMILMLIGFLLVSHTIFGQPTSPFGASFPSYKHAKIAGFDVERFNFKESDVLTLHIDSGVIVKATKRFTDSHQTNCISWVGQLEGQRWGYVILSKRNNIIFGKMETDEGNVQLFIGDETGHQTSLSYNALPNLPELCKPEINSDVIEEGTEIRDALLLPEVCQANPCEDVTIDVIVFYTPRARQQMGGSSEVIELAIATAVSEMNLIHANSEIEHRMSLVHMQEVNYSEASSFQTNLTRLRSPTDGFIDQIHDIRDQYYGDLVSLIVGTDECGLANVNVDSVQYDAQTCFSVVREECLMNKTFAHELGHNFGFRHDRYAYMDEEGELPDIACDYAWGWVNPEAEQGNTASRWRTVMTYPNQCNSWGFNCTRIPYWSNPQVQYNGSAAGAFPDEDGASNAYLLDRVACQVSAFRVPPDCENDCMVFQGCANYNIHTDQGPGNRTTMDIEADFPLVQDQDATVQLCVMYFGDNNGATEQFYILNEDLEEIGQTLPAYECDIPTRICFNIQVEDYHTWISDHSVKVYLDPIDKSINPENCRANRACAELLVTDELFNTSVLLPESLVKNLVLSPNPSSGEITLQINNMARESMNVSIWNSMGSMLHMNKNYYVEQENTILNFNIENACSGIYVCVVETSTSCYSLKFNIVKN